MAKICDTAEKLAEELKTLDNMGIDPVWSIHSHDIGRLAVNYSYAYETFQTIDLVIEYTFGVQQVEVVKLIKCQEAFGKWSWNKIVIASTRHDQPDIIALVEKNVQMGHDKFTQWFNEAEQKRFADFWNHFVEVL